MASWGGHARRAQDYGTTRGPYPLFPSRPARGCAPHSGGAETERDGDNPLLPVGLLPAITNSALTTCQPPPSSLTDLPLLPTPGSCVMVFDLILRLHACPAPGIASNQTGGNTSTSTAAASMPSPIGGRFIASLSSPRTSSPGARICVYLTNGATRGGSGCHLCSVLACCLLKRAYIDIECAADAQVWGGLGWGGKVHQEDSG